MRYRFLFSLLLLPVAALSDGFGGAEGNNSLGQRIRIYEGTEGYAFYVVERGKKENDKHWLLSRECKWNEHYRRPGADPTYSFQCGKEGQSPLAGTRYRVTYSKTKRNSCGRLNEIYLCVVGCSNGTAPAVFYVKPWEC